MSHFRNGIFIIIHSVVLTHTLQGVDTFNKIQKLVHKTNTFLNYDPCLYRKNTKIVKSID